MDRSHHKGPLNLIFVTRPKLKSHRSTSCRTRSIFVIQLMSTDDDRNRLKRRAKSSPFICGPVPSIMYIIGGSTIKKRNIGTVVGLFSWQKTQGLLNFLLTTYCSFEGLISIDLLYFRYMDLSCHNTVILCLVPKKCLTAARRMSIRSRVITLKFSCPNS